MLLPVCLHSAVSPVALKPVLASRHRLSKGTAVRALQRPWRCPLRHRGATYGERPVLYGPDGAILLTVAAVVVTGRDPDQADMRHFQQLPCRGTCFSSS